MWRDYYIRLKNEFIEMILTIQQMSYDPLMRILECIWIVITSKNKIELII